MLLKKDDGKIILFNEPVFKVAELIFNYPNRTFHLREISKETGLSTTAVMQSVEKLADFQIITVEKTKLTTDIRANLEAEEYVFYKRIFNLYRMCRHGFVNNIKNNFNAETIVLFGSFSRGEDIEESDVDILVITKNNTPGKSNKTLYDLMEKELNRKIKIHALKSLEKSSEEFKNAVSNGIVLYGYLKVV
jgi:predicted nucleotidyltransferase